MLRSYFSQLCVLDPTVYLLANISWKLLKNQLRAGDHLIWEAEEVTASL